MFNVNWRCRARKSWIARANLARGARLQTALLIVFFMLAPTGAHAVDLYFGNVYVGQSKSLPFSVDNPSASPITITGISADHSFMTALSGATGGTAIGTTIPAHGSFTLFATVSPPSATSYFGTVFVITNVGTSAAKTYDGTSTLIPVGGSSLVGHGTLAASPEAVVSGGSSTVTLTPAQGYTLDVLLDNGADVTLAALPNYVDSTFVYSLKNITTEHGISVRYKLGPFPVPVRTPALPPNTGLFLIFAMFGYLLWIIRERGKSI